MQKTARNSTNGYKVAPGRLLTIGSKITGYGSYGWIYPGELRRGPYRKAVAVKRFRPETRLTEERIAHYRKAIKKLRDKGADIPPVEFYKLNGEWVQVMQLFDKIHGYDAANLSDEKIRAKLLKQIAATANAGYHPNSDAIGLVKTTRGPRFIVYDPDAFAECERLRAKPSDHAASYAEAIATVSRASGLHPLQVAAELKDKISNLRAIDVIREIERKMRQRRPAGQKRG